MKTLAYSVIATVILVCITILAVTCAYTFNNYMEARRDLVRKEQSDRMINTIEEIGEKVPDFRLFKKRDGKDSNVDSRLVRRFSS